MERLFDKTNPRKNRKITFFAKEIFVTIAGQKKNIRKMIAENAVNTGIYEQIELYGLNPITPVNITDVIEDYTKLAGDLRTAIERGQLAKEMFKNLPLSVRKEFDHDAERFMREGESWMQKKHAEIIKTMEQQKPQQQPQSQSQSKSQPTGDK